MISRSMVNLHSDVLINWFLYNGQSWTLKRLDRWNENRNDPQSRRNKRKQKKPNKKHREERRRKVEKKVADSLE